MKLTIKVTIAFAILCGLMAVGGAFSYYNMGKIDSAFSLVVKDIAQLNEQANAAGQGLLRINKMSNDMVFANTKTELQQAFKAFDEENKTLGQQLDRLLTSLQQVSKEGNSAQIAADMKKVAVDSIDQRNNHVKACRCGGLLNEANVYSKGKSACF